MKSLIVFLMCLITVPVFAQVNTGYNQGSGSGGGVGIGTTTHFSGYLSTTRLGNLQTVEVAGNVGIGTTLPAAKLDVQEGGIIIGGAGDNYFAYNVGIGTLTPGTALDVAGTIRMSGGTAGQAVCFKTDKSLGQCTSVVGVGGGCTCN